MNGVPEQLRSQLFNFQKEAVIFGIKRYGRYLLGDEMGVGKTIQAIAVSCVYQEDWPLLIICPSSLVRHYLKYHTLEIHLARGTHQMASSMVPERPCHRHLSNKERQGFISSKQLGCSDLHYIIRASYKDG